MCYDRELRYECFTSLRVLDRGAGAESIHIQRYVQLLTNIERV
jgi:hypothetical protein